MLEGELVLAVVALLGRDGAALACLGHVENGQELLEVAAVLAQVIVPAHEARPRGPQLRQRAGVLRERADGDGAGEHLHGHEQVGRHDEGAVDAARRHGHAAVARAPAVVEVARVLVDLVVGAHEHVAHAKDTLHLAVALRAHDEVEEVHLLAFRNAVAERELLGHALAERRHRRLPAHERHDRAGEKGRGGHGARQRAEHAALRGHRGHERHHEREARHDGERALEQGAIGRRDHGEAALDAHRLVERGDAALEGGARQGLVVQVERLLAREQLEGQPAHPGAVVAVVFADARDHAGEGAHGHDGRGAGHARTPGAGHERVHEQRREVEVGVGGGHARQ